MDLTQPPGDPPATAPQSFYLRDLTPEQQIDRLKATVKFLLRSNRDLRLQIPKRPAR